MARHEQIPKQQNKHSDPIKILILLSIPLTKQNYQRIGIPFLSKNFTVIVFQCMDLVGRGRLSISHIDEKWYQYEEVESETQFVELLKRYKPEYAIDFMGLDVFDSKIGRILKDQNVELVIQKLGSLPYNREFNLRFKRRLNLRTKLNSENRIKFKKDSSLSNLTRSELKYKDILTRIRQRVNQKLLPFKLRFKTPYIALLAGNKSRTILTRMAKETIWVSSNDFHTFQKVKQTNSSPYPKDYLVFLDDCVSRAHDWEILKMPSPVVESVYFSRLNRFFQMLENDYSIPVVIAGHPNTVNDKFYSYEFNGRDVIYGKTAELVMHSQGVLFHASTSVSYAILSRKPITSVTSEELDLSHYGKFIRSISRAVGSKLVFMDQEYNSKSLSAQIDSKKYTAYELDFLSNSHSNECKPWEAFTEFVIGRHQDKF